jgi:hypothetical protein
MVRTRAAAAAAVLTMVMVVPPAVAGFTLINPDVNEADHEEILECIYGDGFEPVGERDFQNLSLGVLAVRVADFVGDDPLALGDDLDIGGPSPSATDQVWVDGSVLATAHARYAVLDQALGYFPGEEGGAYVHLLDMVGYGCDVTGEAELEFEPGSTWRWARGGGGGTWSSRASDNGGYDAMVTYQVFGPERTEPTFVIFFEDIPDSSTPDFNDSVFELSVLSASPTARRTWGVIKGMFR